MTIFFSRQKIVNYFKKPFSRIYYPISYSKYNFVSSKKNRRLFWIFFSQENSFQGLFTKNCGLFWENFFKDLVIKNCWLFSKNFDFLKNIFNSSSIKMVSIRNASRCRLWRITLTIPMTFQTYLRIPVHVIYKNTVDVICKNSIWRCLVVFCFRLSVGWYIFEYFLRKIQVYSFENC